MGILNKLFIIIILLLACGIIAYGYLSQRGLTLSFTSTEIEQRLREYLPYQKKAFGILEFQFDNPDVELIAASERVSVAMQITLEIGGLSQRKGLLKVSGIPSYRAQEGAFYLSNPRIDTFRFDGLSSKYSSMASTAISGIVRTLYADKPLYRLDTAYNKQKIAKLVLREITLTETHLIAILGPV